MRADLERLCHDLMNFIGDARYRLGIAHIAQDDDELVAALAASCPIRAHSLTVFR